MQTQPLAPSVEAVCPEHPEQPPAGTCQRCGRFVCASCFLKEGTCSACQRRQLQALPSALPRARFTEGLLWFCAALSVSQVFLGSWLYARLEGGRPNIEDAQVFDSLSAMLSVPVMVSTIVTAVVFLFWLHRVVRTANALGLSSEEPRWAVFCWFIPLFNLVKPYHMVRGLWGSLDREGLGTPLLTWWWGAWIGQNLLSNAAQRMFTYVESNPDIVGVALLGNVMAEGLSLCAAVLCLRVVRGLQQLLDARRSDAVGLA